MAIGHRLFNTASMHLFQRTPWMSSLSNQYWHAVHRSQAKISCWSVRDPTKQFSALKTGNIWNVLCERDRKNILKLNNFFMKSIQRRSLSLNTMKQAGSPHTSSKLPFEIDSNVVRDTLLFQFKDDRYYRLLTIFGIVQFFFWIYIAGFAYTALGSINPEALSEESKRTWWGKLLIMLSKSKLKMAITSVLLAYVILAFAVIYPQRTVTRLLLMRGGEKVKVETYTHFARKKSFNVPLDSLSFNQARLSTAPTISMKVKGRWFYFQMDRQKGKFYETDLFDYVVGLKRNL